VTLFDRIKERPPREWGLTTGDILVDLRCALDYAVYTLANTGQDPPTARRQAQFPIVESDRSWRESIGRRKLEGLPQGAVDYIRSVQPFSPDSGNALAAFEELVGVANHRFIYLAWARLETLRFGIQFEGMKPFTAVAKQTPGELEDGAELITFHLVAGQERAKFQVKAQLSTKNVVEPTSKGWIDIRQFVGMMGPDIEFALRDLEDFLTPGHVHLSRAGTKTPMKAW
jgi:hypothetical protein